MELEKIEKMIKEQKLTGKDCIFHTKRGMPNKEGEKTGKVRVLALKKDGIARVEYICPECGHKGYLEKEWKRPFSFNCQECEQLIRVPKLKYQIKKERKRRMKED